MNAIVNFETNPFEEVELNGEKQLGVNARDLHSWLDSKQDFSKWIKRRITKYGFVEGRDYLTAQVVEQVHHQGGVRSVMMLEYIVSSDMAKELSMVECTERGREVRLYFIEQEKLALQIKSGLQIQIAKLWLEIEQMTNALSACGRFLSVNGKQTKPAMIRELDELIQQTQHKLDFDDNQD